MKKIRFNPFEKTFTTRELELLNYFGKVQVFENLTDNELSLFLPYFHERVYKKNEVIFFRGDPSRALYIIKKGGNYGWNIKEGLKDYARDGRRGSFIDPVAVHNRREAESITGGYVYRGRRLPELAGRCIYGDFMTGNIW